MDIKELTKRAIDLACGMTAVSGLFDLWLWFRESAMIPSWSMTVVAAFAVVLMQYVRWKL